MCLVLVIWRFRANKTASTHVPKAAHTSLHAFPELADTGPESAPHSSNYSDIVEAIFFAVDESGPGFGTKTASR